jgi:hypothetical protein
MRKAGYKTFYLGQAVPYDDVKSIYNTHQPQMLITSFTSALSQTDLNNYVKRMATDFKSCTILLTGYQVLDHAPGHKHVHALKNIDDLTRFI